MKKSSVFIGLWLIFLTGIAGFVAQRQKTLPPLEKLWPLPEFRITAVTSARHSPLGSSDLKGRPWIANFIFTHCGGPCPILTQKMQALQRTLPAEVRLLSFTVDPDGDTEGVLQAYAQEHKADPDRWIFARLPKADLYKLVYEGFKLSVAEKREAPISERVLHSTRFVLVDRNNIVRGFYDSSDENFFTRLTRGVRQISEEKA